MDITNVVVAFLLITSIWGAMIGKKNNFPYLLYANDGGFWVSLIVGVGFIFSFFGDGSIPLIDIPPYGRFISFVVACIAGVLLYKATADEFRTGSKFELWILFLGRISFALVILGLIILIIAAIHSALSKRNDDKRK